MPSYTAPVEDMMFLFDKLRNNKNYNELEKYKEVSSDLVKDILQDDPAVLLTAGDSTQMATLRQGYGRLRSMGTTVEMIVSGELESLNTIGEVYDKIKTTTAASNNQKLF